MRVLILSCAPSQALRAWASTAINRLSMGSKKMALAKQCGWKLPQRPTSDSLTTGPPRRPHSVSMWREILSEIAEHLLETGVPDFCPSGLSAQVSEILGRLSNCKALSYYTSDKRWAPKQELLGAGLPGQRKLHCEPDECF